ncbi:hypothetical protein BK658_02540 [Pseudomonas brassicacearum]|uniref:Uncharacterized protein n=1 Tax=Pseudomonas brassicacearum TaxID=930166 RepID=A0A423H0D9_9PSED|nr:hypothetical protein BK658_02540 [Pseudomonas brassicacearum]
MAAPSLAIAKKILRWILGHHRAKGSITGPCPLRNRQTQDKIQRSPGAIQMIIQLTNSLNMTDGSLSTFDISISCLYFFESE